MTDAQWLFAWVAAALVFTPLIMALLVYVCRGEGLRQGMMWLVAIAMPMALLLQSLNLPEHAPLYVGLGGHEAPLGIELALDGLALALLWMNAVVMLAVTAYLPAWAAGVSGFRINEFRVLLLLLWSGLHALYLSADLFNIYVTLEIVTICAVALVVFARGVAALRAAMRYLLFAIAGSIFYLLGVALIYGHTGVLALRGELLMVYPDPVVYVALAAMTAGLAMKAALFPVHGWLPPAHGIAPGPASAVLSALVAKAGAYLILRLWLGPFSPIVDAVLANGLAILGVAGMLYGSLQALRQTRLKAVIAYSTVAQLGYLLLLPALGSLLAWQGGIYHAVVHGLAKAALFLAAANLIRAAGSDRLDALAGADRYVGGSLMAIAVAGVSLAGLPPSGGFIAKWWLVSAALADGQWWWAVAISVGGLLAAAYVLRVLHYAMVTPATAIPHNVAEHRTLPRAMVWPPILLATLSIVLGITGDLFAPFLNFGSPWAGGS